MSTLVTMAWHEVAFATGPADRARAEKGVRAAYDAAGIDHPERFLWVPSPAHGAIVAALLAGGARAAAALRRADLGGLAMALEAAPDPADAGSSVRDAVRTRPWEAARAACHAELGPQEWARAWARTGGRLWEPVGGLAGRIRRGIGELGGGTGRPRQGLAALEDETAGPLLRNAVLDAVLGQHDAPWLSLFDALDRLDGLAGPAEVARTAGWWWPYERLVIISDRPAELHRDEAGRLHRPDGPAVAFGDGFALHAWRGMPVPADFVGTLSGVTVDRIGKESNAELRRVMLEHYGYDRYLREVGAKPLDRDETGVLWRIDLPGDEPTVMVEVVNSSPEPDGTHRTYWLRVPPDTRIAREGVAWTFGLSADEYRPERQT